MKDGNPWVQARTLSWSAVDVLRRAEVAMTAQEFANALVADKRKGPSYPSNISARE
jgi:hypothetical protein